MLHSLLFGLPTVLSSLLSQAQLSDLLSVVLRVLLPLLSLWLILRCARSLLRGRIERESWGKLTLPDGDYGVFHHWENTVGRSRRCDVVLQSPTVSRSHAAFLRNDKGQWRVHALSAKSELCVNETPVPYGESLPIQTGDTVRLGNVEVVFASSTAAEELEQAQKRTKPGRRISPAGNLWLLTMIQCVLCAELLMAYGSESGMQILTAFSGLCVVMWAMYLLYRILRRTAFEIETLAFFLTTLCMTVTANKAPGDLYKQLICMGLGLVFFFVLSLFLRNLTLSKKMRWPAALLAVLLLAFNLLLGQRLFGARNWVSIGPISFQPSEIVKLAFILGGATTLDRMFSRRNLIFTLVFSAFCVGCLGLMSDFGTALIFFATFLAIAFLRSGDLPSIAFMSSAAAFGAFIIIKFKPYIARRFSIYLHAWSDTSNLGYQQTRTMSAIAGGGLFGHGLGNGWLKNIAAANTDLVFGVLSNELGLIVALCALAVIAILAFFAVKSAATARSTFYVIASCSTAMLFVVQTMLNVFGSVDLLPLTGVTFPFVSMGGSSMICCWGLLAYIKAADTRQNAALSVRLPSRRASKSIESGGVAIKAPDEPTPTPTEDEDVTDIIRKTVGSTPTQADDFDFSDMDFTSDKDDDWKKYFRWEEDRK